MILASFRRTMISTLLAASMLTLGAAAQAHHLETITSFSVTNYTGYVINADLQGGLPEYNREHILARAVIQYSTTNNFLTSYNYQIVYRLLDGTNAIPLVQTNGSTSTTLVLTDTVILPTIIIGAKTNTATYVGALRPAVRLDPYRQYVVDVRLFERTNGNGAFTATGDSAMDSPRFYRHFASTNSAEID